MQIKKKKLCIVLPSHWTMFSGGAEQQVRILINKLIQGDLFSVTYLTRNVDNNYHPNGYEIVIILAGKFARKLGRIGDIPSLLYSLNRIKPDVIYQRVGCAYTGASVYYAKNNNCRVIWHISSDSNVIPYKSQFDKERLSIIKFIEKKILEYGIRNADKIIAQTKQQSDLLYKYYNIQNPKIIPNYHEIPKLQQKTDYPIRVIWISNIKPLKQPEIFIKLAQIMKTKNNIEFVMIGRADNIGINNDLLNVIKKAKNIVYLGEITMDEVNNRLNQAHILVNTSKYEGMPNTFIQAWMREVPVVSINVDPDNIMEANQIGICSKSFEQMCDDINLLVNNSELRKKMGRNARELAISKFSEKNVYKLITELSN